jgi:primosomal protein N' (replication factor Y)
MHFVEVLLDQNLSTPLDYIVPSGWQIEVGMRVEVPLKNQLKKGTVSCLKNHSSFQNVKSIVKILSQESELSETQWKLAQWMSHYYAAPLQRVMKCFIPASVRNETKSKELIFLKLAVTHEIALKSCETLRAKAPIQADVLEKLLNEKKGKFLAELLAELGIQRTAIDALVKKKLILAQKISDPADLLLEEDFFITEPKSLNLEQKKCLEAISLSIEENKYAPHLIHGITGSGKTEIYLQAIHKALEMGKGTILLVPEVSLTSQTIERFRARFSQKIAILHHKRSAGERNQAWQLLKEGKIQIAIGARSAIFCPIQNLGLIIVDEEHDGSYKQTDEIPCYQMRDVAVMRAHLEKATIILGSATPSLESRYNGEIGKYQLHTIISRATKANLPKVQIVDMRNAFDIQGGFTHFSRELLDGIKERLKTGEQTLLFLNRRGYHRLQICANCRFTIKCPHCDLGLTFHKVNHSLRCHLCDYQRDPPRNCPSCNSLESLQFKGFGTEHVERSLHAIFPEIRTLRMDRDTTQKKNSHEELFNQFRSHKADVLIGTQMIAKGFHFPSVTLVGVLNSDATLNIPDFRSSEQLFQILVQVAGRSGRSDLPGEVILQTFLPDHPVFRMAAAQDYDSFYKKEIEERRSFNYPPFCHFVKLLFSSKDEKKAENEAIRVCLNVKNHLSQVAEVFPVTAAGHPKIKDLYRFQFLIRAKKLSSVTAYLASIQVPSSIYLKIDVDPLSTFF